MRGLPAPRLILEDVLGGEGTVARLPLTRVSSICGQNILPGHWRRISPQPFRQCERQQVAARSDGNELLSGRQVSHRRRNDLSSGREGPKPLARFRVQGEESALVATEQDAGTRGKQSAHLIVNEARLAAVFPDQLPRASFQSADGGIE